MGSGSKKHKKHKKRSTIEDEDSHGKLNIDESYVEGDVPPRNEVGDEEEDGEGGALEDGERSHKKSHKKSHKRKQHKKKDKKSSRHKEADSGDDNEDKSNSRRIVMKSSVVTSTKRHHDHQSSAGGQEMMMRMVGDHHGDHRDDGDDGDGRMIGDHHQMMFGGDHRDHRGGGGDRFDDPQHRDYYRSGGFDGSPPPVGGGGGRGDHHQQQQQQGSSRDQQRYYHEQQQDFGGDDPFGGHGDGDRSQQPRNMDHQWPRDDYYENVEQPSSSSIGEEPPRKRGRHRETGEAEGDSRRRPRSGRSPPHSSSGRGHFEDSTARDRGTSASAAGAGGSGRENAPPPAPASTEGGGRGGGGSGDGGGGGQRGEISMSVEETNRLRAKLGLAPLKMNNQPSSAVAEDGGSDPADPNTYEGWEGKFVHNPADSITAKKEQDKLREKLAAQKRKRELKVKMDRYKGLGEEDETNSASAWVAKSRQMEEQRLLAEQRAKALQEMDDEFGVGGLLDEEQSKTDSRNRQKTDRLTAAGLAGLTVEHSKDTFMEGEDVILVLKDKDILDDTEGETLVNPTLSEREVWANNAELRKKKPTYNPYEDQNDPFAAPKDVLSKYDDDAANAHKASFRLEAGGNVDTSDERVMAKIKEDLQKQTVNLESKPLVLATEYLTKDEMTTFKKPKKKIKKLRKRAVLRADDLLAEESGSAGAQDRGSRNARRRAGDDGSEVKREEGEVVEDMEIDNDGQTLEWMGGLAVKPELDDDDEVVGPADSDEDLYSGPIEEDEAQNELSMAILKTRRLNAQQPKAEPEKAVVSLVARIDPNIKEEPMEDSENEDAGEEGADIVLSTISEYCRGLGDIPTFGMSGNRLENEMVDEQDKSSSESEDEEDATSRNVPPTSSAHNGHRPDIPGVAASGEDGGVRTSADPHDPQPSKSHRSGWVAADFEGGLEGEVASSSGAVLEEGAAILDEESLLDVGVGSALKLAVQKGLFEKDEKRKFSHGSCAVLLSKSHQMMDKQYQDIDDKYARKMDRMGMGGPITDFNEKKDYKPEFTLEYADSKGRNMDKKEAFNYLSWKFHGKKPGKKKLERIGRKHMHDRILKEMTSCDTPLGTLEKQQQKQKTLQQPYLVLTGQGMKETGVPNVIKKE